MNIPSKQEVFTEDEDVDISVDDESFEKACNAKTESMNKFGFSISNILSDNFGPKPVKIEDIQNEKNIFRPFEMENFIYNNSNNVASHKSFLQNAPPLFLSNIRLSDIFDYSTKQTSPQSKSDNSVRNCLYNSLASYPKIHEEILNSHKYPNSQAASNSTPLTSNISPLGGLTETVSHLSHESKFESVLSSALVSEPPKAPSQSNSQRLKQSSHDSVDSDDCASEASASKDESQKMWPAWVS